jgi:hypothetical protein
VSSPIQITNNDVKLLNDHQLVRLLWQLVYLELRASHVEQYDSQVPLSIYIKDGGIDGVARWANGLGSTSWFPSRNVGFQAKAADMDDRACGKEVLASDGTLKRQVRKLFDTGGIYVLFLARDCVEQSKQPRIQAIEESIRAASIKAAGELIAAPDVRIYDASDIAAWVNLYPAAVTTMLEWLGRPGSGVMSWTELAGCKPFQITFSNADQKRTDAITALRPKLFATRDVTRVLGASGMGKSRLVFEAFRPPPDPEGDPEQASRSNSFCYLNAARVGDVQVIMQGWRRQGCIGTVILDDCPLELHEQICEEVRRSDSKLSLITIGSDLDPSAYAGTDTKVLLIEPATDGLIQGILEDAFAEINEADRRFICDQLAQGYPLMAIRVAEARRGDAHLTARLTAPVLAKLLGRPVPVGSAAERVIGACALFESVGVEGAAAAEREFVRTTFCPEVSAEDFYREVIEFERSGALTRYGRVVQVRPKPLAIRLAADWWERCTPERAERIVGLEFPASLADSFCSRLRMLDFVPSLVVLCAEFCGSQGPFGQAKVLSSDLGSRLFRAVVEVNPVAGINALNMAFAGWGTVALQELRDHARRNIVWSLERLAFRERTFESAVEFLSRLARAENEKWSNNATGILSNLFMILLPGTEVSLTARIAPLLRMSRSDDAALRRVAIGAMDKALKSGHFTGSVGAETQGSSAPLTQYRPKVWKEVFDYWAACLLELCRLVEEDAEFSDQAASVVASHIRGLVSHGRLDDIEIAIARIARSRTVVWTRAIDEVRDAIKYEGAKAPPEVQERLNSWLNLLVPSDIVQRLRLVVTEAPFEHEEAGAGEWVDVAAGRAQALGQECGVEWERFIGLFHPLLLGGQQQAYLFGKGLALGSALADSLFNELTSQLVQIQPDERNPALLSGWLEAVDERSSGECDGLLERLSGDSRLQSAFPTILRGLKLNDGRVRLLESLLQKGAVAPRQLLGLSYGQAMRDVSVGTVSRLRVALMDFGTEGAWVALDVLFMYIYSDQEKKVALDQDFKAILMRGGMLTDQTSRKELHAFEKIAKRLIPGDPVLAESLMAELLNAFLVNLEIDWHTQEQLLSRLLSNQLDVCWPLIKTALLANDGTALGRWNLTNCLGRSLRDDEAAPISLIPLDYLGRWCDEEPLKAPELLAEMVPVLTKDADQWRLSNAVMMLLDRHGDQNSVRAAIGSSLNTFSWSGSLVPYYDRMIEVLEPLRRHEREVVRTWTQTLISEAQVSRDRERLRAAEQMVGRY